MKYLTLNNGKKQPVIGLGTWKSEPNEVSTAVKTAIGCGYEAIDCAWAYSNEAEIGEALSTIKYDREKIFFTSKLWMTRYRPDLVEPGLRESLQNLRMDYLDLFLLHWPMPLMPGDNMLPMKDDKPIADSTPLIETWRALEDCVNKGLVKSIGVSNFNKEQLEEILKDCTIKPVVNQIEFHPYLQSRSLIEFCHQNDIQVTAYSPLGSPDRPDSKKEDPTLLEDPVVTSIADKHSKSPAQICIRFAIDCGLAVIPKSKTEQRIKDNFNVFDFKLEEEDLTQLKKLDRNFRYIAFDAARPHPNYPFK